MSSFLGRILLQTCCGQYSSHQLSSKLHIDSSGFYCSLVMQNIYKKPELLCLGIAHKF